MAKTSAVPGSPRRAPPAKRPRLTYRDYVLLSAEKRYELIDGGLVMPPAPNIGHQKTSLSLSSLLERHVKERQLGLALTAPTDVKFSEHDTLQPDLIFVSQTRLAIVEPTHIRGTPDWVAEIVSPGSEARDYESRKRLYARFGVPEYWIVDPSARSVEVHVLDRDGDFALKQRAVGKGRVQSVIIAGFTVSLKQVFAD